MSLESSYVFMGYILGALIGWAMTILELLWYNPHARFTFGKYTICPAVKKSNEAKNGKKY